jgi:hypothetical protein
MNRAARRRAARDAKASRHNPTGQTAGSGSRSEAGATALDAIRVNGRETFFAKTFALMESDDPRERYLAEFMLRGAWRLSMTTIEKAPVGELSVSTAIHPASAFKGSIAS